MSDVDLVDLTLDSSADEDPRLQPSPAPVAVIAQIPIYPSHISILRDRSAWLDDEIVNAYLHLLVQSRADKRSEQASLVAVSSFFYTLLEHGRIELAHKFTRRIEWSKVGLALIPVNLGNAHWALAALHRETSGTRQQDSKESARPISAEYVLRYYDSLMSLETGKEVLRLLKGYFVNVLGFQAAKNKEAALDLSDAFANMNIKDRPAAPETASPFIQMAIPKRLPQQTDSSSCGVFLCKYAWCLANGEPLSFPPASVFAFRERIVDALANYAEPIVSR